MKIYLNDGTQIKVQATDPDQLLEADFGISPGYIHIKKHDRNNKYYYTLMTIMKDKLLFIDYDNKEKAGVEIDIWTGLSEKEMISSEVPTMLCRDGLGDGLPGKGRSCPAPAGVQEVRVPVHNDRDPGGPGQAADGDRSEDH